MGEHSATRATAARAKVARGARAQPRVLVLPFANVSSDPDTEYFADGLTEELIADLSRVQSLLVISRASAMKLKARTEDIRTIAETRRRRSRARRQRAQGQELSSYRRSTRGRGHRLPDLGREIHGRRRRYLRAARAPVASDHRGHADNPVEGGKRTGFVAADHRPSRVRHLLARATAVAPIIRSRSRRRSRAPAGWTKGAQRKRAAARHAGPGVRLLRSLGCSSRQALPR